MPFDHKLIEDALNSNVDPKEVEAFAAESDPLVKDALAAGVPLTEVINHYKSQGGEQKNEDQIPTNPEGASKDRRTQDGATSQVQASTPAGVQALDQPSSQDQGIVSGDDQASLTTQVNEGQTQDAPGGIQGTQEGQIVGDQVPARNQAEIAPPQAAMQAAPFGAESVPSAPAKTMAQTAFEGVRDFGAEALSYLGKSLYSAGAGIFRDEPEYIDLPSLGAKVKNPRYEENKKIVDWFEGNAEKAGWTEEIGAKPLSGGAKMAADITGGLLALPVQLATGPVGFASMIGQAYGSSKNESYQKAKESGLSDDEAIKKSETDAIASTATTLPLYFIGGTIANKATDKLISSAAPKLAQASVRFGLNAVANTLASATSRGVNAALQGEDIGEAVKDTSIPGFVQDIAFAAHASVSHFKEQAAQGNGKNAARELSDPVLDQVAKDPEYADVAAPEVAARAETRIAQEAKQDNLPETSKVLEVTAEAGRELAPTEPPKFEEAPAKTIELPAVAEKQIEQPQQKSIPADVFDNILETVDLESSDSISDFVASADSQEEANAGYAVMQKGQELKKRLSQLQQQAKGGDVNIPQEELNNIAQFISERKALSDFSNIYNPTKEIKSSEKLLENLGISVPALKEGETKPQVLTPVEGADRYSKNPQERVNAWLNTKYAGGSNWKEVGGGYFVRESESGSREILAPEGYVASYDPQDGSFVIPLALTEKDSQGRSFEQRMKDAVASDPKFKQQQGVVDIKAEIVNPKGVEIKPAEAPAKPQPAKPSELQAPSAEAERPEVAGKRIAAASYTAPDGVVYEGASHLEAMQKAKEAGSITKEQLDAKQDAASRNTPEFGFTITDEAGNRTQAPRNESTKIARASGQAIEESLTPENTFKNEQGEELIHSNQTKKDDFPKPGEAKPEQTFIQKAESWADSVIKESAKRVSTGLDPEVLAAYAVKGSIVIGRGVRNFGVWSGEMVKQFGESIRPHLKDIWSKSREYAVNEGTLKKETEQYFKSAEAAEKATAGGEESPRRTMERVASLKETPEVQRAMIEANEFYNKKTISDDVAREWVDSIPEESREVVFDSIMSSLGENEAADSMRGFLGAKIYSEKTAAGDNAGAAKILGTIAKDASTAARLLRSMQEFYKGKPEGFVRIVEKMAEKLGVKLKQEAIDKITDLSGDFISKRTSHEELAQSIFDKPLTKKEYNQALKDLKKSGDAARIAKNKLDYYINSLMPKSFKEEIYPSLLKGGLLTPMSIATNIQANLIRPFLDMPSMSLASASDKARSLLTGKPREIVYGPQEIWQYLKTLGVNSPGMVSNFIKSIIGKDLDVFSDLSKLDIKKSLSPKSALRRLISTEKDRLYEGEYTIANRASDFAEGVFGVPANFMFDMLAIGDHPFRTAAKKMSASSIARQLGLTGVDYAKFLDFPELGIKKYAKENTKSADEKFKLQKKLLSDLRKETSRTVFEQENQIADVVNAGLKRVDKIPGLNIIARSTIPFVKTPINVIDEVMQYTVWPYAMGRMYGAMKKGNVKEAQYLMGKAVVGAIGSLAAAYLYKQGILTAPADPRSKEQELGYATIPSGSINISAIQRLINGDKTQPMAGDKILRADKLGLLGGVLITGAMRQKAKDEQELMEGKAGIVEKAANEISTIAPKALSFSLNQTFLKGTNDLLQSLIRGEGDKWFKGVFGAASSAFIPNTFSAISRATRDYMPDVEDDSFYKSMKNTIKDRFGFTGAMKDIPTRVDFWGRPVKQTPEGADPILYNFLDMSKSRDIPNDPVSLELLHLYHATGDKDVIPSSPQKTYTYKNTTYGLTPDEYNRYATIVGESKRRLVEKLINKQSYMSMDDEKKTILFKKMLNAGNSIGKKKFEAEVRKQGGFQGQVKKLSPKEMADRTRELNAERESVSSLDQEDQNIE